MFKGFAPNKGIAFKKQVDKMKKQVEVPKCPKCNEILTKCSCSDNKLDK